MTALLSRDGKNFTLACDRCGQMVTGLAPSMGTWDVAWSLFGQDGWRGADLATGPHACGRCDGQVDDAGMVEQAFDRQTDVPVGRALRRIVLHRLPDMLVVRPAGGLDLVANVGLQELLRTGVEPGGHVLFDFTRVTSVDSGTFAVLVNAHRRAVAHQARIAVAGARADVRAAIELLCLHRVLPMFDDQRDAMRWLRGERRAGSHGQAPRSSVRAADVDAAVGPPSGS
ncbi:hypothetical protein GCM10009827_109390 [Dactylosporangium maewongense]|uniref:STAS domain-containing protein n=1 Tax=Dactylosporangium maewongense TaxID=634393 RepID=A0ABN2D3R1_9ACTN